MLTLKNISFRFFKEKSSNYLVKNLNLSVENGKIQLIFGKSGVGKSTLLKLISGIKINNLDWSGKIFLENKNISNLSIEKRKIGLLMQERILFPHLNVINNLLFAMPNYISLKQKFVIIKSYLENIQMLEYEKYFPNQLSGGQITRIACIRTLLSCPQAILMDEPFSSLDKKTLIFFRNFVINEIKSQNIPCIIVSHSKEDKNLSDYDPITLK